MAGRNSVPIPPEPLIGTFSLALIGGPSFDFLQLDLGFISDIGCLWGLLQFFSNLIFSIILFEFKRNLARIFSESPFPQLQEFLYEWHT